MVTIRSLSWLGTTKKLRVVARVRGPSAKVRASVLGLFCPSQLHSPPSLPEPIGAAPGCLLGWRGVGEAAVEVSWFPEPWPWRRVPELCFTHALRRPSGVRPGQATGK